jgi:hypothetical protein
MDKAKEYFNYIYDEKETLMDKGNNKNDKNIIKNNNKFQILYLILQ